MIRRKALIVFSAAAAVLTSASLASAATICVNPAGGGGCLTTIQAGVDAAVAGDTVAVAAGTYYEGVSIPSGKDGLIIAGSGAGKTVVDGGPPVSDDTFEVLSNNVTISDLTARNGTTNVFANGVDGLTLSGATLQGAAGAGVDVVGNGLTVIASRFEGSGTADDCLSVNGNALSVSKSSFRHCGDAAIHVQGDGASITKNTFALVEGAIVTSGAGTTIIGNKVVDSYNNAIEAYCPECSNVRIEKNSVSDCADDTGGVYLDADGPGAVVAKNKITRVADAGVSIDGPGSTTVDGNKVSVVGGDNSESCFEIGGTGALATKNKASTCAQYGFSVSGENSSLVKNSAKNVFAAGFSINANNVQVTAAKATANAGNGFQIGSGISGTALTGDKGTKNRVDLCDQGSGTVLTDNKFGSITMDPACVLN